MKETTPFPMGEYDQLITHLTENAETVIEAYDTFRRVAADSEIPMDQRAVSALIHDAIGMGLFVVLIEKKGREWCEVNQIPIAPRN